VIGGAKGKIYQRIARHGNGWFAPIGDPGELRAALTDLRAACDAEGRDFAEIEITCMWPGQGGPEAVAALEEAGASRLVVPVMAMPDPVAALEKLSKEIIRA
jgi:hypothetical protein